MKALLETFYIESEYFSPRDTLTCGQIFRYENQGGVWRVYSGRETALLTVQGDAVRVDCTSEIYFRNFFDLNRNYAGLNHAAAVNPFMLEAVALGKGIRLLKQPSFETLISFIISQNNNIPRIKGIIERLCAALGERQEAGGQSYFAFPTAEAIADSGAEFLPGIGAGYRAPYILETARRVAGGEDTDALASLGTDELKERLLSLKGVGNKVCDCVLLFGYGRLEAFPVDTWIEKVYYQHFSAQPRTREQISEYFVNLFGDTAGYAQQLMFHFKRNLESKPL